LKKSKSLRVKKSPAYSQIKSGVTASELSKFKRTDLVQFCKEHTINYAGKKELIVKRILLHFEDRSDSDEKEEKTHSSKKK